MKKISTTKTSSEMQSEYDFDYQKAKSNRFAPRIGKEQVVVVLDPDISEVFTTAESVNTVLRALITTMPKTKPQKQGHLQIGFVGSRL
jgi:hypothetical protein